MDPAEHSVLRKIVKGQEHRSSRVLCILCLVFWRKLRPGVERVFYIGTAIECSEWQHSQHCSHVLIFHEVSPSAAQDYFFFPSGNTRNQKITRQISLEILRRLRSAFLCVPPERCCCCSGAFVWFWCLDSELYEVRGEPEVGSLNGGV